MIGLVQEHHLVHIQVALSASPYRQPNIHLLFVTMSALLPRLKASTLLIVKNNSSDQELVGFKSMYSSGRPLHRLQLIPQQAIQL